MPVALSAAFIIEEGLPLETLDRIAASMGEAARKAGVPIVTGDTKVVERGAATACSSPPPASASSPKASRSRRTHRAGHGDPAVGHAGRSWRGDPEPAAGLAFGTTIESDSAALHRMVGDMLAAVPSIACLRDPTRGGLSATLNELAEAAGVG
jgi:hydrogenase expression/formation protein HypE